jgi:GNAT superfamily N-acetyltransferase
LSRASKLENSTVTSPPPRLAEIRPLLRADLEEAAALFELGLGSGVRAARPAVVGVLERTLLDNPWSDPDLPSLVATDDHGRIIGFLAGEVRRMRFGARAVRAVSSQHFVVDPAARRVGVGAVLLQRMFKGAQDVTWTYTGSGQVRQIWESLGGQRIHLKSIDWVRVLQPWRLAHRVVAARTRPRLRAVLWPLACALDGATATAAGRYLEPGAVDEPAVPLSAGALLDALPAVSKRLTLYPDYDETYLDWLFRELGSVERRGRLIGRLVSGSSGRPLGWYVYYLRPGSLSEVLQVFAHKRDIGRVLDHLLRHAHSHGSAAVRGRLEPNLVAAVAHRRCLLWHQGGGHALIHSRDPELLCALHSDGSIATRLEGEWWGDAFT